MKFIRIINIPKILLLLISGGFFISLSLSSLYHLSNAAKNPELINQDYIYILIIAAIGLGALLILTIWQILNLLRFVKNNKSGAKLSISYALSLLFSALIPLIINAYFSGLLLSLDLDKAFNTKLNQALEDSLELTNTGISMRVKEVLIKNRNIATYTEQMTHEELLKEIEKIRNSVDAISLSIFDEHGVAIAFAHVDFNEIAISAPSALEISRVREESEIFQYIPNDNAIRVLTLLPRENDVYYAQGVYAMPPAFERLATNVRTNRNEQQQYFSLRPHIRNVVYFGLSLVFFLSLLIGLWLSALFSQYMTAPISSLIEATQRIKDGNYFVKIKTLPRNELGKLARHFNSMSEQLAQMQAREMASKHLLALQKEHLESIMSNISSGVLVFNENKQIVTSNDSAMRILADEFALNELLELLPFTEINHHWQQELTLSKSGTRKVLICRGNRFSKGLIIAFDDITDFVHNQRNAAWEEVAKRLAHEIKNPLTPIQLQTERLQRKLIPALTEDKDRELLQRATNIIINQVEAMKQLVSDFGQFARPLDLRFHVVDLSALLLEIQDFYQAQLQIFLNISSGLPNVKASSVGLRQVLLNLCKNSVEADAKILTITVQPTDNEEIEIKFEDDGIGFQNLTKDPFEPYVTNKTNGTGLGLAIVKKIINEHGGRISAGNGITGAQIIFYLLKVE